MEFKPFCLQHHFFRSVTFIVWHNIQQSNIHYFIYFVCLLYSIECETFGEKRSRRTIVFLFNSLNSEHLKCWLFVWIWNILSEFQKKVISEFQNKWEILFSDVMNSMSCCLICNLMENLVILLWTSGLKVHSSYFPFLHWNWLSVQHCTWTKVWKKIMTNEKRENVVFRFSISCSS